MKEYTTAEIFEELWKRIEYDANVSEELASESNELQDRINKAIEYIEQEKTRLAKEVSNTYIDTLDRTRLVNEDIYNELDEVLDILKGSDKDE